MNIKEKLEKESVDIYIEGRKGRYIDLDVANKILSEIEDKIHKAGSELDLIMEILDRLKVVTVNLKDATHVERRCTKVIA